MSEQMSITTTVRKLTKEEKHERMKQKLSQKENKIEKKDVEGDEK